MDIMKAKQEDAKQIATLIKSGWNAAYKGLISDNFLKNMDIEKMAEGWKDNIEKNQNIYVYKIEDEVLGIIKFGKSEDTSLVNTGEIYVLYVKPEEKRKGIGEKLLSYAKDEFVKHGYKKMIVWCLKGNIQGSRFYKKMQGKYIGDREYELKGLKVKEEGYMYELSNMELVTLESERLKLRKIELEEAANVYQTWTNDKEVAKYVRWNTHKSIEETKQWIAMEQENCKKDNYYDWGIELKEERKLIGSIGAHYIPELDRYEIGYVIAKKYWGRGIVTEAVKCIIDYLAKEKGIKRYVAIHAKQNPASGAVMQKVGFKYIKDEDIEKFDGSETFDSKVYYLEVK